METFDLPLMVSFQRGMRYRCEDALEEAWSRIARLATKQFTDGTLVAAKSGEAWESLKAYALIRIQQAVEFRRAAALRSLISSPLPLYYSLLNLTRAILAVGPEVEPSRAHGLVLKESQNLWDCSARVTKGTFKDLLLAHGCAVGNGDLEISLSGALSRIAEVSLDYGSPERGRSRVIPLYVQARFSGTVHLNFFSGRVKVDEFRESWSTEFPYLEPLCELADAGASLRLREKLGTNSDDVEAAVIKFCADTLWIDLLVHQEPIWHAIRSTSELDKWPRAAYYLAAMFILGSLVRYEPEGVFNEITSNSEAAWFLGRFIVTAERFYPQLMLRWLYRQDVFFPVA